MLMPRKVKHRKVQRGGWSGKPATSGTSVSFGNYGLKAMEEGLITARQIESSRRAMTRSLQRGGKVWIRIFPDKPMTKKGEQTPMGKGKGSVDHFVAKVRAGKVLFELDGITKTAAVEAMRLAAHKLAIKTKFVVKS
ncbi:MAG: 50S ribosomal protein L16 [Candidatus Moranbacteria bacterium]|nr:50S ribosomal protein L16 [Candidatus Moranbacteria bacterium]